MRTTAILNLKGGVGKTVTSINLAAILAAEHQKRVLLIDADSQCNTSEFFGALPAIDTLYDVLKGRRFWQAYDTGIGQLSLLPASDDLMDLDLASLKGGKVTVGALAQLRKDAEWEHVIIDCPPAFSAASAAALLAADDVIIPIKLDAFSLRGMANLMKQIANMKKLNPKLKVAGVLPTMYYTSKHMIEAMDMLRQSKLPVFEPIRRSPKVDDMTFAQEPLCIYSPRSAAGVDYRRFANDFVGGAK